MTYTPTVLGYRKIFTNTVMDMIFKMGVKNRTEIMRGIGYFLRRINQSAINASFASMLSNQYVQETGDGFQLTPDALKKLADGLSVRALWPDVALTIQQIRETFSRRGRLQVSEADLQVRLTTMVLDGDLLFDGTLYRLTRQGLLKSVGRKVLKCVFDQSGIDGKDVADKLAIGPVTRTDVANALSGHVASGYLLAS